MGVKPIQFQADLSLMERVMPVLITFSLGVAPAISIDYCINQDKKEKNTRATRPTSSKNHRPKEIADTRHFSC